MTNYLILLPQRDFSNLDKVDRKIITILSKNARTPSKEIAIELRNEGYEIHDRTIRKRIDRLEKIGIIKGYKAVLSDISGTDEFEALFLKLKATKSLDTITESIKEHVKTLSNYLLVATLDGEWNMMVVTKKDELHKSQISKIIEKYSGQISDYRVNNIQMKDIDLLNMSHLLVK
jgi:DNA-binding Lrp family transcriptional regulator